MESDIKVKATSEQMSMFGNLYCVKRCERIKWLGDGKGRWLYKVTLRHADDAGELHGTYTVETLMRKFSEDAYTNFPCYIAGAVKELIKGCELVLSAIGDKQKVTDLINDALQKKGMNVKVCNN